MSNKEKEKEREEWVKRHRTDDCITNSDNAPHANI